MFSVYYCSCSELYKSLEGRRASWDYFYEHFLYSSALLDMIVEQSVSCHKSGDCINMQRRWESALIYSSDRTSVG